MLLYSSLLLLVLIAGSPYWLVRMLTSGRYRAGLAGRLGQLPRGMREAVSGRSVIWIHAVSVGEVLAATRLVEELKLAMPGTLIVVSTTTETGQELARSRFPGSPIFYLPLDFAFLMRRSIAVLQPRLVILMESELWPNMITECDRAGIPMAVVNARISDRSFPRYRKLRRLWLPLMKLISAYLAQSEETAERLIKIGVPREKVSVAGNLKYDVRAGECTPIVRLLQESLPVTASILVAGSTLEGEEELLLQAWREVAADSVLVIAPRHPARFEVVAGMITAASVPLVRASELRERPAAIAVGGAVLLDTIGDLATAYSLATVAFVGGSLVPRGGHNPLEPAQFGVPVLMGESYENFREIVQAMREEDAVRIVKAGELEPVLAEMMTNFAAARSLGERGKHFFQQRAGATARVIEVLKGLIR